MAAFAQPELVMGLEEASELELPASAGDSNSFGMYISQPSDSDALMMGHPGVELDSATASIRTPKEETEFCTPPASSAGNLYIEKEMSHVGSISYPKNTSGSTGLSLGADHAADASQAYLFSTSSPYPSIPNTSPMTGIDSGSLSHTEPSSPVFSLAMLEETIASSEFAAQLQAARAAEHFRGNGAGACRDAALCGPEPDKLDSIIAAQIAVEIRKDARRRPASQGLKGSARNLSKKHGSVAKRPASGLSWKTKIMPQHRLPPRAPAGTSNSGIEREYMSSTVRHGSSSLADSHIGAAGLDSSSLADSHIGTGLAELPQHPQGRGAVKKQQTSTLRSLGTPVGTKVRNSNGGLEEKAEKTFKCELCPKVFERRYNLKVHMRRHTGATPYRCPKPGCTQMFRWRSSMRHHMKAQHKMVGPIAQMPGSWTQDETCARKPASLPAPQPMQNIGATLRLPSAVPMQQAPEDPVEVAKREEAEVNSWFR